MNFLKGKYGDEQIDCSLDLSIDRSYRSNQNLIINGRVRGGSGEGCNESTNGDERQSINGSISLESGSRINGNGGSKSGTIRSYYEYHDDDQELQNNGFCWQCLCCCCSQIYTTHDITEQNLKYRRLYL